MLIFITGLLCFMAFLKPRSKYLYVIIIFFLWLCMAGTYGNADEDIYMSRYNNPNLWVSNTEFLYNSIMAFFRNIGCSYELYKAIITLIQLLLISSTIKRYSIYPNLVLISYFWFPFLLDIAQMRNALATAIMIFGIQFLINDIESNNCDKKITKNEIKYIICITMATLVHTATVGWILLLLAKRWKTKTVILFTVTFNIIVMICNSNWLLNVLTKINVNSRITAYLSIEYQNSEWRHYGTALLIVFLTFTFSMTIYYYLKHINIKEELVTINVVLWKKINIILLCVVSIIIRYTGEVYRIQVGLSLINYMIITNCCSRFLGVKNNEIKLTKRDCTILGILVLYVAISVWVLEVRYGVNETIFIPVFKNNRFIDMLF